MLTSKLRLGSVKGEKKERLFADRVQRYEAAGASFYVRHGSKEGDPKEATDDRREIL